jgi:hypothetical protein
VLANALAFLWALRSMLWPDHRWPLTTAVLALGAAHLLVARAIGPREGAPGRVRVLFAGLALTCVTLAIPIRLEGIWITLAWAVEGVVLVWSGLRLPMRFLRIAGLVLFALAAIRLCTMPMEAARLLLNPRFAAFMGTVFCYVLAVRFARAGRDHAGAHEINLFGPVAIAASIFALRGYLEVWDPLGGPPPGQARPPCGSSASVLWLLCAGAQRSHAPP